MSTAPERGMTTYPHTTIDWEPAGEGEGYYVSVVDAGRVGLLLGPFERHIQALRQVDKVRTVACRVDPWAHFYSFGTVKAKSSREGRLNSHPDLTPKLDVV